MSIKKGNRSWKPANLTDTINKEPGYRYRFSRKDPNNLAKKAKEGWETVSGIESSSTKHVATNRVNDGKPLTSVQEGNDWVLQRLPEELARERDAYYSEENERRTSALTAHLKQQVRDKGGNAPVHGEITISSRKGN